MAKWTVRTADGELTYQSFGEVEQAWLSGLVGPDDELLEEGHQKWRKAGSFPVLAKARRHGNQVWGGTQMLWMIFAISMGSVSLYLLVNAGSDVRYYIIGGICAFIVASVMIRVTVNAYKKSKPHG